MLDVRAQRPAGLREAFAALSRVWFDMLRGVRFITFSATAGRPADVIARVCVCMFVALERHLVVQKGVVIRLGISVSVCKTWRASII